MTLPADTEATAPTDTKAISTSAMEVTPLTDANANSTCDMEITPLVDMEVIAPASIESSIHTNRRFPEGPNDRLVLNIFFDHVTLRLW